MSQYTELFKSRGLFYLLSTQFLGALNDNTYKMAVSLFAVSLGGGAEGASGYLSLVGAIFILPYLLFSGYAGHLADVFSKRDVMVAAKFLEIVAMAAGIFAFASNRIEPMLAVLFLMAVHSTFFSPAKYGIVPEMLPNKELSRANGLLEMATFLAIILGTSLGSLLVAAWKQNPERIGLTLTALAVAGTITSFAIPRVPRSGSRNRFRVNPWGEILAGTRSLWKDKTLRVTILAGAYFWFLGALLQMTIILLGKENMGLDDLRIGLLLTFLAVGVGCGSFAAGRLSGDKVELGLVPLGSIAMACFSWLLAISSSYVPTAVTLALLGFSAGLFIIPLNALVQQRSAREEKGRIIATANFIHTLGILLASATLWLCRDVAGISADRIILTFGLLTLAVTAGLIIVLPQFFIRFTLWLLTHTLYKIHIAGQEHVPFRGPALLVSNHLSYVDALLVSACVQRFIRFMILRPFYESRWLHWLLRLMHAIPVSGNRPREIVESLNAAREELRQGHVVCIFPEGGISRTGHLLPFKRGFEKMLEGTEAPIIPVFLDQIWGSIFSFKDGRFFWKWPKRVPYPVTVRFGAPMPSRSKAHEVRQAVMELASEAAFHRRGPREMLHFEFIKTAKSRPDSFCMADSTGKNLSYGRALAGSILLANSIARHHSNEKAIGLMLPASVGGALANIAVLLAGKLPVNLNWTAGRDALESAISQCGIRTILTSRAFLSGAKLEKREGMVFLEEVSERIGALEKIRVALLARLLPARLLQLLYARGPRDPHDLATVIFSSGSTGQPKGVMLSHHNILSNIEAMGQVFPFTPADRILGALPFFHSFGFTGTLFLPILSGMGAVYHPNPLDAKTVGEMVSRFKATMLITTPTFCAGYLRKVTVAEFSTLRYAIVGAEKLREPLAKAFKEKFGLDLLEGYGCTELSPVVSVNVPDIEDGHIRQTGTKPGSVGRPIPGVAVKVVHPETGAPLAAGREGLLLIGGQNRMLGYLGQPEKTSEVLKDGWYVTGDIGSVDEDGFIQITDRLSRFSKIGGEMVPHVKVEEAINEILGDRGCIVTGVPDHHKGERLVAFHTCGDISPDELWERLTRTDLPRLWIPKRENLYYVEEIPLLGSGKVDLKAVKAMAQARAHPSGRGF